MKDTKRLLLSLILTLTFGTSLFFLCCQPTEQETARSLYDQAIAASDQDSTKQSEQLLNRAIRLAQEEGDLHTLYLAQLELSQSLSWSNTEAALDMARRALGSYQRKPDNARNRIIILDYIATYASQHAYNKDTDFDEATRYAKQACQLAHKAKDSTLQCQTLTTLANIHWATGNYNEALHCARKAVRLAPPELLFSAQQVMGRSLVSLDSLAEAEHLYRSMDYGTDIQAAYIVESNLAKLALRRSDTEAASEAIEEAFGRAEELYFNALAQKDAYYQDALQQEQENERMRYRQRLHIVLFLGGIILIGLLATVAVREVRLRRRQQKIYEHERQVYEHEATVQREQLRQRDATVDFLKNFIYERSEVVQKLAASGDRYVSLSKGEWAEVERMLNTIDNDRFARLRKLYPELKEEDLQLCILTRLRLTNRTIGNVYAISISAVQHRKLKLKKEVFGETDPDTTLEQVLDRT